ncbi:MAG TPA: hypothetical protein VMW54_00480 [Terriglobia bacterium]|nr:hypothetical protein [Terriglobia bacterium]
MKQDTHSGGSLPHDARSTPSPNGSQGARSVFKKVFSFPVFMGMLLLAGLFVGRLLNLQQVSSAVSSSTSAAMFWLEGDTWWHLAVGNQILKTHAWPTHDPYSFTVKGSPWIAYEWLGEVVIAIAWRMGGMQALMILLTLLGFGVLLLLYYYAYLRSGNLKAAFVACVLLLPLASLSITLRPQLLGYAFLVMTLILVEKFRQGHEKALWALPLIFLFWVNTHGTFVIGFVILGAYWASGLRAFQIGRLCAEAWTRRQRQRLELTFLLCLLASVVTPYGTGLAAYPLEMASSQHLIVQTVQEWQPLNLSQFYGKYFLALLLLFWIALIAHRRTYHLQDLLLLFFATAETFMHARFILLFVPIFAPLLADLLAEWVPQYEPAKDPHVLNLVLITLIITGIVKFFPSDQKLEAELANKMPVQAVSYLRAHPDMGRMLNDAYWGGYMIDKLGPAHKVFIDGRFDIYEYSGVIADYLNITHLAPDARFLLRKYKIQSCFLPRESQLAVFLAASPRWRQVYQDNLSAVFVRRPDKTSENAAERKGQKTEVAPSS